MAEEALLQVRTLQQRVPVPACLKLGTAEFPDAPSLCSSGYRGFQANSTDDGEKDGEKDDEKDDEDSEVTMVVTMPMAACPEGAQSVRGVYHVNQGFFKLGALTFSAG